MPSNDERERRTVVAKEKLDGLWWLPEAPDKQIAGSLLIFSNGRQELHLIGSLRDPWAGDEVTTQGDGSTVTQMTGAAIESSGLYPRLHGLVGATSYDLEDCFQVSSSVNQFGGVGAEKIHVHQSFSNVLFDIEEEVKFTRARVSMAGLAYWAMKTGLKESMTFKEKSPGGAVTDIAHQIKIAQVPDIEFEGPDGEKMAFTHSYTIGGDRRTELRFTQDFKFIIVAESLRPAPEYMGPASALQDLLTIAIGRPAALTEVAFRHPDTKQTSGEKEYYSEIVNRAQWLVRPAKRKKPLTQHDVVFNLDDFGGSEQVTKWLAVAKGNRSTLSRVMATKYASGMYVSDVFFSCAAALEAYDRTKFSDGAHYGKRLKRCAAHAGSHFQTLVGDVETWAKLVKDNRNTVAHHNAEIAEATTEQIVLGRSAYWLFIFCLLRDIDAPVEVFDKLADQQTFRRLTSEVAGVLAAPQAI